MMKREQVDSFKHFKITTEIIGKMEEGIPRRVNNAIKVYQR